MSFDKPTPLSKPCKECGHMAQSPHAPETCREFLKADLTKERAQRREDREELSLLYAMLDPIIAHRLEKGAKEGAEGDSRGGDAK